MRRFFTRSSLPRPLRLRGGPRGRARRAANDWRLRATWGLLVGLIVGAGTVAALERHPIGLRLQREAIGQWFRLRGGQPVNEVAMLVDDAASPSPKKLARLLELLENVDARGVVLAYPALSDASMKAGERRALLDAIRTNGRVWVGVNVDGRLPSSDETEGALRPAPDLGRAFDGGLRGTNPTAFGARDLNLPPGLTDEASAQTRLLPISSDASAILSAARGAGHLSLGADSVGRVQVVPLRSEGRGRVWNALSAQAVFEARAEQQGAVSQPNALSKPVPEAFAFGPKRAPALLLNYPHEAFDPTRPYTWSPFPQLSLGQALRAPDELRLAAGRWLVIGPSGRAENALFTPNDKPILPLEVQAVALDNLLTGRAIVPAPSLWRWLLALLPCAVVGGFAAARRPGWSAAVAVLCAGVVTFLSLAAWNLNIWLDVSAPFLGLLVTLIIGSIARARWRERQATRVSSAIEALTQASDLIAAQKHSDQLLPRVLAWAESALQARGASVLLLDADGQTLRFACATGPKSQELMHVTMRVGQGIAGWVAQEGVPAVVHEAAYDWRFNDLVDRRVGFHTRSLLAVPLRVRDRTLGVIEVVNRRDGQPFDETDAELLQAVANQAALVLENAKLYERLRGRVEESESELSRANGRLQAEKTLLQTVLQSMTDGVVVTDRRGLVQLMNQAASALLPELGPSTLGRPLADALPELNLTYGHGANGNGANGNGVHGDANSNGSNGAHGPKMAFRAPDVPSHEPCVLMRGDVDAPRIIEARSAPLLTREDGETRRHGDAETISGSPLPASGRIWVFSDVTEARNVERAKSDFVSFVAHEMRSPLTSISGFSSMLQKQMGGSGDGRDEEIKRIGEPESSASPHLRISSISSSSAQRFLSIIHDESERLTRLINNLLDVARIEAGRELELNRDACDVGALLHAAADSQRSYSSRHRIVCEVAPDLPFAFADRDKVLQVLINLLSNAVKYSPGGTVTLRAEEMRDEKRETGHALAPSISHLPFLLLSVSDQGPGIAPEDRARLFSRFERGGSATRALKAPVGGTGARAKPTGTGLGLFLSRYLVEAHGGRIWLDPTDRGAKFCFSLPIAESVATDKAALPASSEALSA